jgi:hypothetical protein
MNGFDRQADDQRLLPITRPDSWLGRLLTWLEEGTPTFIPLASFATEFGDIVRLYGARYDLSKVLVGGKSFGDGHFEEYVAIGDTDGRQGSHRLLQRGSVTFSETDEKKDYLPARKVSVRPAPIWAAEEAVWPTIEGQPMTFIGQVELEDTPSNREFFTSGITAFLFASRVCDATVFKVVTQQTTSQDVESHYASEDARRSKKAGVKRAKPAN